MNRALALPFLCLAALGAPRAEGFKVGTQLVLSQPIVALETYGPTVEFAPRAEVRPGVEVRYRNYGFSFSVPLPDDADGAPRFASGGLSDARTFYHGEAWGFEGYHRYARGFHARAGADSAEISHPDMNLRSTSLTVYRAAGRDSRVYRLSDGLSTPGMEPDLILAFGFSQNRLRDEVSFLQGTGITGSRFNGMRDLSVYSASAGMGLALSTNFSGLYFDPALFVGFGMQHREWGGDSETLWNLVKVNLRMRLGYRTRWFDAGAGFENDAHAALAGEESAVFSAVLARAQIQVYL
ncbi:MAG: hypothetical protein K0Q91_1904 [Fibrobacteria bacterium]|nr:hypothetical protein [Fibrobacteria bacterium]